MVTAVLLLRQLVVQQGCEGGVAVVSYGRCGLPLLYARSSCLLVCVLVAHSHSVLCTAYAAVTCNCCTSALCGNRWFCQATPLLRVRLASSMAEHAAVWMAVVQSVHTRV